MLLAADNWIAAVSGNFNNPANWSTGLVPDATSNVTIAAAAGVVVTVSDAQSVASLNISSPVTITSPTPGTASLTIQNGGGLILDNTTLQIGSADATSSGALNFIGSNQVIGAGGNIIFAGTAANPNQITVADGAGSSAPVLNFQGDVGISGSNGEIVGLFPDCGISNSAGIEADGPGKITIQAGSDSTFSNFGTVSAVTGTIDLEGAWSAGQGHLNVSGAGTLDLGGAFPASSANSILNSGGTVNITGTMTLDINLDLTATTGSFNLDGGTIVIGGQGTINADSPDALVLTTAGGTLNMITLGPGSPVDATNGNVNVVKGLTLTSTTLTLGASMRFSGTQQLAGTGTITLQGGAIDSVGDGGANPATLSIGNQIAMVGTGTIAGVNAGDSIDCGAPITANTPGGVLNLQGGTGGSFNTSGSITVSGETLNITGVWGSSGQISASAGAVLNLGDQSPGTTNAWTNTSFITADSSIVNIGGNVSQTQLGIFTPTNSTVNLVGTLNITRGNLDFNSGTGNWNLAGGTINGPAGATITSSEGFFLALTPAGGTLAGGLTLGPGTPVNATAGSANVSGGLILNTTTLSLGGSLTFLGTQALTGNGSIELGQPTAPGTLAAKAVARAGTATLTIGGGILIQGSNGAIEFDDMGDSVINDGTIRVNGSGGVISLDSVTNNGTFTIDPGATISVAGNLVTAASSVVNLEIAAAGGGSLMASGNAALDGTLDIQVLTGFIPSQGTTYNILTYSSVTGSFTNLNGLNPPGAVFTDTVGANALALTTTFGAYNGLRPTAVTLVSSPQQATFGAPVTFTATVTAPAGDGITPTGLVTFLSDGTSIGTAAIAADETAVLTTASLPAGHLMITAVFAGDTNYAGNTSTVLGEVISSPVETIGGVDPTFGNQGFAGHSVGISATSGLVVSNGQSVITGSIGTVPNESFGITRYNADGTLDTAFGSGGVAKISFGSTDDHVAAESVLPGGQTLIAGTASIYSAGTVTSSEFALAEFNPDGSLNTSFGNGTGMVLTSFAAPGETSNDVVKAMVVSGNGDIYLGGSSDAAGRGLDFAVAAFSSNGASLTSFNGTGKELLDFSGGDDSINTLALQTNGDLVAAGSTQTGTTTEVALARFLPSGLLDKHFGIKGLVAASVRGIYDSASSIVIQPNNEIVVGGYSAAGSGSSLSTDFLLQRYTSAGRLDRSFAGGTIITSFGQPSAITQLILQSNGEILASGKTTASLSGVNVSELNIALARYTFRGALDTTFNVTGKAILNFVAAEQENSIHTSPLLSLKIEPLDSGLGNEFNQFTSSEQGVVAITMGGAILAAGTSGSDTLEARIITTGVDLVATVISPLPAAVPGGFKGIASVDVAESASTQAIGTVTIQLEFATDAQGDNADMLTSAAERINLRASQRRAFKFKFVFPSSLPAADYYLLASVVDGNPLTDLNDNNNTAVSSSQVKISPPAIELTASALSATTPLIPGKSAGVEFTMTNDGNVLARGSSIAMLFLSPNQTTTGQTAFATIPLAIGLPPSKFRVFRLKALLPRTQPDGSFYLLALIDPTNSLGSDDHSDSLAIDAAMVTVT